ncbi:MAG: hypothetical protein M3144_00845 [Actinomycetota bacterium]|nr:hypothetical protein [Actinomycetota bacterium]
MLLILFTASSVALVGLLAQPGGAYLAAASTVRPIPTGNGQQQAQTLTGSDCRGASIRISSVTSEVATAIPEDVC